MIEREPRIYVLPTMMTAGNILSGFVAILQIFKGREGEITEHYYWAIIAILAACLFDVLDGRVARLGGQESPFGRELDSIADIVSFGVAPIALFLTLLLGLAVPAEGPAIVGRLEWRLGLACCIIYVCCAAIRLARYNAENVKDESATRKFSGIPSPGAAAGFIAILIFHEDLSHSGHAQTAEIVRWCIAATALSLGLLMISRIPYKHLFNEYVRRENPTGHIVLLLILVVGLGVYWVQLLWVVAAALYVVSGLVLNWKYRPQLPPRDEASSELN